MEKFTLAGNNLFSLQEWYAPIKYFFLVKTDTWTWLTVRAIISKCHWRIFQRSEITLKFKCLWALNLQSRALRPLNKIIEGSPITLNFFFIVSQLQIIFHITKRICQHFQILPYPPFQRYSNEKHISDLYCSFLNVQHV